MQQVKPDGWLNILETLSLNNENGKQAPQSSPQTPEAKSLTHEGSAFRAFRRTLAAPKSVGPISSEKQHSTVQSDSSSFSQKVPETPPTGMRPIQKKVVLSNEIIYQGPHKNDLPHDRGTLTFLNGDRYTGDFVEGVMHGKGEYVYQCGDKYVGDFVRGVKEGNGLYLYQDGRKYIGTFEKNKENGLGRLFYPNQHYYEGEFLNGKRHGIGTLVVPNQAPCRGEWKKDVFVKAL